MKNTRGPWKIEKHVGYETAPYPYDKDWYTIRMDPKNCYIAQLNQVDGHTRENIEANAYLIAAGPELLEACQAIVQAGTACMKKELNWQEKIEYADRLARQAISKVEGI